jgi:hypothetical protein
MIGATVAVVPVLQNDRSAFSGEKPVQLLARLLRSFALRVASARRADKNACIIKAGL